MWNAPVEQPDHADRACQTALDMLRYLPVLDRHWLPITGGYFQLGIGIHSGATLVGNAGSRRRLKYGPRGHTVNLASRLEGLTKQVGVSILVSGATRSLLHGKFTLRRVGRGRVAGVEEIVELYELAAPDDSPDRQHVGERHAGALRLFEQGHWPEALAVLEQVRGEPGPPDGPSNALQQHIQKLLQTPPAAFDGVWTFDRK